jgi:hypothetical protein
MPDRFALRRPEARGLASTAGADVVVLLEGGTYFAADVAPAVEARYVRVEKTAAEYFFLGEVRVHGK